MKLSKRELVLILPNCSGREVKRLVQGLRHPPPPSRLGVPAEVAMATPVEISKTAKEPRVFHH